ncbi:MAG: lipopolysaccharide transport periplasmic protein LptA [Gammaproteobacteria bacterium]|nr:lipopolysaccharide transport periplasmic protein LptA [Gammaproteobacteria bacterium]
MKKNPYLLISLILGLLLSCSAAVAQENRLTVQSDTIKYHANNGNSVFEGNVVVNRGRLNLWADRVELFQNEQENDYIVADGSPVRYIERSEDGDIITQGKSNQSIYRYDEDVIQLTGNVEFESDGNILRAHQVIYNTESREVHAFSDSGSEASGDRQRTTVIIDDN